MTDRPFGVNIAQAFVRDPAIASYAARRTRPARGQYTPSSHSHAAIPGNGDDNPKGQTDCHRGLDITYPSKWRGRRGCAKPNKSNESDTHQSNRRDTADTTDRHALHPARG